MEIDPNGRGEMFVVIPRERKMVSAPAIYDGMLRLSFLLEACQPGTIPDANLIAAVLDLVRAPSPARSLSPTRPLSLSVSLSLALHLPARCRANGGARVQRRSIIMPSCPARAQS